MAEPSTNPTSKPNAKRADWNSSCCRRSAPISTAASNAPNRPADMSSTQPTICRIDKLQAFVDAFAHRFNHHRPHDSLAGQTPAEYLQTLGQGDPPPSHMC